MSGYLYITYNVKNKQYIWIYSNYILCNTVQNLYTFISAHNKSKQLSVIRDLMATSYDCNWNNIHSITNCRVHVWNHKWFILQCCLNIMESFMNHKTLKGRGMKLRNGKSYEDEDFHLVIGGGPRWVKWLKNGVRLGFISNVYITAPYSFWWTFIS